MEGGRRVEIRGPSSAKMFRANQLYEIEKKELLSTVINANSL